MRYFVALVLIAACGERPSPAPTPIGRREQAVLSGAATTTDPQIFILEITQHFSDHTASIVCSATLLGSKSLLTAAHCLDKTMVGAHSITARATNVVNRAEATAGDYIAMTDMQLHPQWAPTAYANDFAFVLLERSASVPPKPWNSRALDHFAGEQVRIAGYGQTESGTYGEKREVEMTCAAVTSTRLVVDQKSGVGACHGDSGGPMFHVFDDGVERIIGVNTGALPASGDQDACHTQGLYGRLDVQRDFILAWFAGHESPQCIQDGMCKQGCDTPDVDCLCEADGFCSQDCPNLLDDPDCPRDCVENDVCSEETCPVPDPDCIAVGEHCTTTTQCASRQCINDAQNDDPYCSMSCLRDADCPETMSCNTAGSCIVKQLQIARLGQACQAGQTRCADGSECAGGFCVQPCANDANCKQGETCSGVADGVRFCRPGSGTATLDTRNTGKPSACNGAGSAWIVSTVLLTIAMTLRRRRLH